MSRQNRSEYGAKSPQEKAYLMKALAAGHPIDKIEKFDQLIHAHGDDPRWLRDHLTPIYNTTDKIVDGRKTGVWARAAGAGSRKARRVSRPRRSWRAMVGPLYALGPDHRTARGCCPGR